MAKKQEKDTSLQELKAHLKNKDIQSLYFFHGEESFLLNHYMTQLKKLILDPLTESFNYHRFTNENFEIRDFAAGTFCSCTTRKTDPVCPGGSPTGCWRYPNPNFCIPIAGK